MKTVFVLVIILTGISGKGAVTTQEFLTEASCDRAAARVEAFEGTIEAFCVEKRA